MLAALLAAAVVGARPARRSRGAAGQPPRRARTQRPARVRAAGLPHHGPHGRGRGRREPCAANCWARWTPSAWRAACRGCASPAWPTRCACTRAASAPRPAASVCRRSTTCWPRMRPARAAVAAQRGAAARRRARLRRHRGAGMARGARAAGPRRRAGAAVAPGPAAHRAAGGCAPWCWTDAARTLAAAAARGAGPRALARPAARVRRRASRPWATGCASTRRRGRARAGAPTRARGRAAAARPQGRCARRRAWRSRPRSARCWSCWRATCPTRRSGWPCRWAKRPSSGT